MGVIIDSSILIAAERGRFDLPGFLSANSREPFFITVITASELLHGCVRAVHPGVRERRQRFVESILGNYSVLSFTLPEARAHALLWAELEMNGTPVGERDMFIAAIARATGHAVATLNREEFSLIPGLPLLDVSPFALPGK